jgi:hypothetical protein
VVIGIAPTIVFLVIASEAKQSSFSQSAEQEAGLLRRKGSSQ